MNKEELAELASESKQRRDFAFVRLTHFFVFTFLINGLFDSEYVLTLTLLLCGIFTILIAFYQFVFWSVQRAQNR